MGTLVAGGPVMVRAFVNHEHGELASGMDGIHELARALQSLSSGEAAVRVGEILRWVEATLKPHLAWEEHWLFPQLDALAGSPWATRAIRYDHRQIARKAELLGRDRIDLGHSPSSRAATELRSDLDALETLLRANVEREEQLLLPILDAEAGDEWWTAEWRD
ncbi:MAG: hemerythrin domain-containing protein [Chloroflexota bacterium]